MEKSFSYKDGYFEIASNQYVDFGSHLPIIRSFSLGENIPPRFPFYGGSPNTYHFMFDYLVSIYEKIGLRIDLALNLLSLISFTSICILIYYFAQLLFGKNKIVGILSVFLFLFNSSLSFVDFIKKYGFNSDILQNIYHHNVYLGNGPFGESAVSIFWNLNTYLNQRHFLFGLAVGLIVFYLIFNLKKFNKLTLFFFSLVIGILPLWHMTVFLSILTILLMLSIFERDNWKNYLIIIFFSIIIAAPQLYYISSFSENQIILRPGFLLYKNFNLITFIQYWALNLGLSILTILFGFIISKKRQKVFFLSILPLFIIPNIFQFGAQMFDNHKFFNIFIVLANMYSAYFLYFLFRKKLSFKIVSFILMLLLVLSGIIDFFVIKNDIKTKIKDYPADRFQTFLIKETPKNAIFLSNVSMYDPINLAGRQSFLGEPHYLFLLGKNPDERINKMNELFTSLNVETIRKFLISENISYIAISKKGKPIVNKKIYEENFTKLYEDQDVSLFMSATNISPDR